VLPYSIKESIVTEERGKKKRSIKDTRGGKGAFKRSPDILASTGQDKGVTDGYRGKHLAFSVEKKGGAVRVENHESSGRGFSEDCRDPQDRKRTRVDFFAGGDS